jgi:uncharacterized protein
MATLYQTAAAPVEGTDRMDTLDAVRGAAILGILLANVVAMSGFPFLPPDHYRSLALAEWHEPSLFLVLFFVEAKFYSLFSLLFGVGFAVFIQRAAARGANPARLFRRRLVGLLIIGLVHTFLIWMGDILATYAVIGFALVPFIRRDDRSVVRWAIGMLLLPILLYAVLLVGARAAAVPSEPTAGAPPQFLTDAAAGFANGSYVDVVKGNVIFTVAQVVRRFLLMFFPRVFGMFLLGFYIGRRRIFANLDAHRSLLRRVFAWGTILGFPLAFIGARMEGNNLGVPNGAGLLETTVKSLGVPLLSLGYTAGLCLLYQRSRNLRRAFAPAGQMALTNYLLQSVAAVAIFYGIGIGLFGRVPLVLALPGAVVFFALQMIASRLWLARAAFGPAEWLWRMFTYRRVVPLFPMRNPSPAGVE